MKLAGDLTHVLVYGLLLITAIVFISTFLLIVAGTLTPWTFRGIRPEARPKIRPKTKMALAFIFIASGVVLFYLIHSLFFQFYMFETNGDKVDLRYSWPKASIAISRQQFQRFEIESDNNGDAQLFLIANGKRYSSVAFNRFVDTNAIRMKLLSWKENPMRQ